jgi:hypothetical protein
MREMLWWPSQLVPSVAGDIIYLDGSSKEKEGPMRMLAKVARSLPVEPILPLSNPTFSGFSGPPA